MYIPESFTTLSTSLSVSFQHKFCYNVPAFLHYFCLMFYIFPHHAYIKLNYVVVLYDGNASSSNMRVLACIVVIRRRVSHHHSFIINVNLSFLRVVIIKDSTESSVP